MFGSCVSVLNVINIVNVLIISKRKELQKLKKKKKNSLVGFHTGFGNQVALLRLVCPALLIGMLQRLGWISAIWKSFKGNQVITFRQVASVLATLREYAGHLLSQ